MVILFNAFCIQNARKIYNLLNIINNKAIDKLPLKGYSYTYKWNFIIIFYLEGVMLLTDSQLIREIKEGRIELYSQLIEKYEKKIHIFIHHLLKTYKMEIHTEDICQETFYKAFKSLKTFRDEEATFSTWLHTIARNTALSELRKLKHVELSLEENATSPQASELLLPEQELLKNERVQMVREAINSLPDKQRSALILREYEQMDYKEIANILNSTVSSVKSLLFRARTGIKSQLEPYVGENQLTDFEGMNG